MKAHLVAMAATVVVLSGCSAFGDDTSGVQVAAAFYPLAFVSERVAGDHATVTNLTTPGTEPHDLELTIKQTAGKYTAPAKGQSAQDSTAVATNEKQRDCTEYIVIQKLRWTGEDTGWRVWGHATPTTVDDLTSP